MMLPPRGQRQTPPTPPPAPLSVGKIHSVGEGQGGLLIAFTLPGFGERLFGPTLLPLSLWPFLGEILGGDEGDAEFNAILPFCDVLVCWPGVGMDDPWILDIRFPLGLLGH